MPAGAPPGSPIADRGAYRRGMVLGLTMAELFMLIAFLLALAIAWAQAREQEEVGSSAAVNALQELDGLNDLATAAGGAAALQELLEAQAAQQARLTELDRQLADLQAELSRLAPVENLLTEIPAGSIEDAIELTRRIQRTPALREAGPDKLIAMARGLQDLSPEEAAERIELVEELVRTPSLRDADLARLAALADEAGDLSPEEFTRRMARAQGAERLSDEDLRLLAENADILETVRGIAGAHRASNDSIGASLAAAFEGELAGWNASFDAASLTFRFDDPDALFEQGAARLRPGFRTILGRFCPDLLGILHEHEAQIEEIRFEGHTSSEWRSGSGDRAAYFSNMRLSQERTQAVLEYCLSLPEVAPLEAWARAETVAVGMSSNQPVRGEDGAEDARRSRRVEVRIVTDAAARLNEITTQINGASAGAAAGR